MCITDLLLRECIKLNVEAVTKEEVIEQMVTMLDDAGFLSNKEEYKLAVLEREKQGSTAIDEGIAIPHGKSRAVMKPGVCVITSKNGIDFGAPSGTLSHLIFMIAAPEEGDIHLEILSEIVTLLMDSETKEKLLKAETEKEFLSCIDINAFEVENDESINFDDKTKNIADSKYPEVLAVTACPTGIAHTYIAQEALCMAAEEMGVTIKVETNGAKGRKDILTDEEIKNCKGIIIAADKTVDMERFEGKRVIVRDVSSGINHSKELIEMAMGKRDTECDGRNRGSGEKISHSIYRHLMNGVSYMLPFVIGGGVMIALAFLIDTISGAPKDASFGTHTLAAQFFKSIGGMAFGFMLPVLAGYIAKSIGDRPGLAIGFVGGYLASIGSTFYSLAGTGSAVSGFIGACIAGFVGGYIAILIKKVFSFLPESVSAMIPVLFQPLLGIIIMGAFMCAVNPFMGNINLHMTQALEHLSGTSRIVLGFITAAMMAVDMGGPCNKAAYLFGTAAIVSGGYNIMAAVMIGGMVPPLVIALCSTLFKDSWPKEERKSAMINYVLGACFITEGAVPFAAADPIRVISSCVIGSGISGALSMAFNCTLRAPHGGIFVFPLIGNVGGYIIALAVGTVVGALMLAFLRKHAK